MKRAHITPQEQTISEDKLLDLLRQLRRADCDGSGVALIVQHAQVVVVACV